MMFVRSAALAALAVWAATGLPVAAQQPPAADPLVRENATVRVSDRVYVIPDFSTPLVPNVGIIVGTRATLVVDTGLGPRNGETILREVAKISRNSELYVVSTHFHPEHALGEPAFPATAKLIRSNAQQQDIDEFGLMLAQQFSARSPLTKQLLDGVKYRKADILFERDYPLDLGGVRVQITSLGPTHTRGDTGVFVVGERVLFSGDVVMNHAFLAVASPYASITAWLSSLDRLAALDPARVVPSHGEMGDGSLVDLDRDYLTTVQTRVRELKAQGKPMDEVARTVSAEMQAKYPDWTAPMRITGAVNVAYAEAR
jgi:glyoxylase-like metal-dependent hydrolase (beta-lactamase superfamily II)